jgi:hypothetical protein
MRTTITAYGHAFTIWGDGFDQRPHDFARAVEVIERTLASMAADAVSGTHAADLAWQANDREVRRPHTLDAIEVLARDAATAGWRKPEKALVVIIAA